MGVTGGQATSISLDKEKYGTDWLNDGVQGGSPVLNSVHLYFLHSNLLDLQTYLQLLPPIRP